MDLSKLLCNDSIPIKTSAGTVSSSSKPQQPPRVEGENAETETETEHDILTPERRKQFFKMAHNRQVSSVARQYPLPLDQEETKVA